MAGFLFDARIATEKAFVLSMVSVRSVVDFIELTRYLTV
jgi:hypothetical protein